MGTIVTRQRKNGTKAFLAKISIMREGQIIHRENKTFDRRPAAAAWITKREEELAQPGVIERDNAKSVMLKEVINTYLNDNIKPIRRTKRQVLETVREMEFAQTPCDKIASHDIVSFARELSSHRKPQTVANYMSHLASIFSVAKPAWNYPLDKQAMDDAFIVMKRLGLVGRSEMRDRRPTLDELERMMTFFQGRPSDAMPMAHICAFAIFSTRRQSEITSLKWADLDEDHSRILVRDMKDPKNKAGNNIWCDLTPEALEIIQAMPRVNECIFPYKSETVGSTFATARRILEIEDLKFHDLRHEGVSRLFELGWTIPHVAAVSGHRSWQNLKRYTHIRARGDKYKGWKWLPVVTSSPQQTDKL